MLARGLDPLHSGILSQVFGSRRSARQRGVIEQCGLARRSLDGQRRSLARLLVAVAAALLATLNSSAQDGPRAKALVGGTLIDGFGGRPLRNSVVLIEGERIKAVGQVGALPVPAGAEVISTEGMTVLPGLWDMHVHLMINGHADYAHWDKTYPRSFETVIMPASAKQLLLAGVTSARDLGAPLEASIDVRDRDQPRARFPGRRCTSPGRSFRTRRIRAPSCSAGA